MAEYDTETVAPDASPTFQVGNQETYENVLIDVSASGAGALVYPRGSSSTTVRNVGFQGAYGSTGRAISDSDPAGNTSVIDNVYIADGVEDGVGDQRHPQLGFWCAPDHAGHIEVSNCNISFAHDNSFYGSAPGSNEGGGSGSIHYYNCYSQDSWVSGFRISRGTVEQCVAHNTSTGRDGRPLWVWPTERHEDQVEVIDCTFAAGGYPHAIDLGREGKTTEVSIEGTTYVGGISERGDVQRSMGAGNSTSGADVSIPAGVPTGAEQAASGESSTGGIGGGGASAPAPDQPMPDHPVVWITDEYIEDVEGTAVWAGSDDETAEYRLENVHVDGADIGVLADGGPVECIRCEIRADEPKTTENGGEVITTETNWGEDADPVPPTSAPMSAREATGQDN